MASIFIPDTACPPQVPVLPQGEDLLEKLRLSRQVAAQQSQIQQYEEYCKELEHEIFQLRTALSNSERDFAFTLVHTQNLLHHFNYVKSDNEHLHEQIILLEAERKSFIERFQFIQNALVEEFKKLAIREDLFQKVHKLENDVVVDEEENQNVFLSIFDHQKPEIEPHEPEHITVDENPTRQDDLNLETSILTVDHSIVSLAVSEIDLSHVSVIDEEELPFRESDSIDEHNKPLSVVNGATIVDLATTTSSSITNNKQEVESVYDSLSMEPPHAKITLCPTTTQASSKKLTNTSTTMTPRYMGPTKAADARRCQPAPSSRKRTRSAITPPCNRATTITETKMHPSIARTNSKRRACALRRKPPVPRIVGDRRNKEAAERKEAEAAEWIAKPTHQRRLRVTAIAFTPTPTTVPKGKKNQTNQMTTTISSTAMMKPLFQEEEERAAAMIAPLFLDQQEGEDIVVIAANNKDDCGDIQTDQQQTWTSCLLCDRPPQL